MEFLPKIVKAHLLFLYRKKNEKNPSSMEKGKFRLNLRKPLS